MLMITILRIVIRFQRRHKCTIEGLGPSFSRNRRREQQKNPSIPDSIWQHNESTIIDTLRQNHDEVQAMTAIKGFAGNGQQ
jgi:hypothetical protein